MGEENGKRFTTDLAYVQKIKEEISKMKKGSIVLMDQITTISKQIIFDDDIKKKARLSNNSLDLIDNMLKKLFTKKNGEL